MSKNDQASPAAGTSAEPRSMAVPLAAFAAGAVVAVLLGVFGRVHDPTLEGTVTLGFRTVIDMKTWVSPLVAALVVVQLVTALWIYGRLGIRAPSWLGGVHRASGTGAVLLAVFLGYHCLWALGLEVRRLPSGEEVPVRTFVHGLLGCLVLGAVVVKVVAVRSRRAPGWFLPLAGGLLFTLLIATLLTSTVWYVAENGWPSAR